MNLALEQLKQPKTWIILAVAALGVLAYLYLNREYTSSKTKYEQTIKEMDSTYLSKYASWSKDSLNLDSSWKKAVHEKDSLSSKMKETKSVHTVTIKTIYKDSIREITVTDSQIVREKEEVITKLTDSVASSKKTIAELSTQVKTLTDSVGKKKVETETKYVHDTTHVAPGDKRFSVAGGAFAESSEKIDFNYGLEGEAAYKVMNPVYVSAGLRKDGLVDWTKGYRVKLGAGVKFDF